LGLRLNLSNEAAMHETFPLRLLGVGKVAYVREVLGSADYVHRLHELGLRDGAEIEMMQRGSPCIIRLGGQRLCVRTDALAGVFVQSGSLP
jgi:ferrous iron transport protein A